MPGTAAPLPSQARLSPWSYPPWFTALTYLQNGTPLAPANISNGSDDTNPKLRIPKSDIPTATAPIAKARAHVTGLKSSKPFSTKG
jgi:hypothetical protein